MGKLLFGLLLGAAIYHLHLNRHLIKHTSVVEFGDDKFAIRKTWFTYFHTYKDLTAYDLWIKQTSNDFRSACLTTEAACKHAYKQFQQNEVQ